jgi:hypothetical protein
MVIWPRHVSDTIGEFWRNVCLRRIAAWGSDFGSLIGYERQIQRYTGELVEFFVSIGVVEEDARTWLATYAKVIDQRERRRLDAEDEEYKIWLPELRVFLLNGHSGFGFAGRWRLANSDSWSALA